MATWKKVVLWLTAGLVLTVGGCVALLDRLFSGMCSNTIFQETASPNGKLKAVLFQIDCGATADFNSQLAIVDADFNTAHPDSLPKGFFVADRDHGRAPAGVTKGPEVRLNWLSANSLEVQYHQFARVFRSEESQRGVAIRYQVFQ